MNEQRKQYVINALVAGGGNVVSDAENGRLYFKDGTTLKGSVNLSGYSAKSIASVAARSKVVFVDFSGDLAVSTRYNLIRTPDPMSVQVNSNFKKWNYAYSTPDTIAVQATEKNNLIMDLVGKVNADITAFATAYQASALTVELIAGGVTALGTAYAGMWVFQGADLASATWKGQIVKLGSYSAAVGQVIHVANTTGTLTTTNTAVVKLDDGSGTTLTNASGAANAIAVEQAMAIIEDSNYMMSPFHRGMANWFMSYPGSSNLVTTSTTEPGLLPVGIGDVMLENKAVYTVDKLHIRSGEKKYDFDVNPVSGKTYTTLIITSKNNVADHGDVVPDIETELILYVDESNGTYLAALKTALGI